MARSHPVDVHVGARMRERRTLVFFEAPHRIVAALADIAAVLGPERAAVVARELTKAHETVYRGTLRELAARAATEANFARGEITLVVHGAPAAAAGVDEVLLHRTIAALSKELPPGRVAAVAAPIGSPAVTAAATRNGAGRQTWNRKPPPTSATPSAMPRMMCCTLCARPYTASGNRSG